MSTTTKTKAVTVTETKQGDSKRKRRFEGLQGRGGGGSFEDQLPFEQQVTLTNNRIEHILQELRAIQPYERDLFLKKKNVNRRVCGRFN